MSANVIRNKILVAVVAGLASLPLSAALAAGPGVHGRVFGHDEKGASLGVVAGAKIEFQGAGSGKAAETTADKNGYYKVDLPPGDYLYKIEATGYRKEDAGRGMKLTQSEGYAIFNLAVTKGQDDPNRKPREIPPKKIGKLRGRVLEKTPNGLVGIADAGIALRREGSRGLAILRSRATAEGNHQVGDYEVTLEAGSYRASVRADGFETFIDLTPIEVPAGGETTRDFVLTRSKPTESKGQGIRGVVTIIDSETTPPPIKIQIRALGRQQPPIDVQQGSNVSFSQDLPPGRYRVTASAEGFPAAESPPVYVLEGRYSRVNLALRAERVPEPKTIVEVFAYTKPAGTGQATPLAGATVSLLKAGADPLTAKESTTDATGHAIFPVEEAGEYVAEAHLKGYGAGNGRGTVALGQSHEVGIELVKEASPPTEILLTTVVTDAATKRPLAGARVLARQEGQSLAEAARGTTDAKGEAALRVTREGAYTALAQLAGYEPDGVQTAVRATATNRAVIALKPIAVSVRPVEPQPTPPTDVQPGKTTVNGYVAFRETSGQLRSVPGTNLIWERVAFNQPAFSQFATTGNNGKYQIELLAGQYQVRVEPPAGFERLTERVDVPAGTHEKYFIVRRTERPTPEPTDRLVEVTGQVVTETSAGRFVGVPKAEILLARGSGVARVLSSNNGNFAERLPADRYRVYVRAAGYDSLDMQTEVRTDMSPLRLVLHRSTGPTPELEPSKGALLTIVVVERRAGVTAKTLPPLAGAQVHLSQAGRPMFTGQTSASGRYSVRVKPGSYTVGVGKEGYAKASAEVAVADRDITHQVVLSRGAGPGPEPTHKPTLTVHVARRVALPPMTIKPTGTPLAGTQVTIMRGSQQMATGKTNAAGNFSVQLPAGNYAVKAIAQGYATAGKTIVLTNRDAIVDFQLEEMASSASASSSTDTGAKPRPSGAGRGRQDRQPVQPPQTWYIVEHRDNPQAAWVELGRFRTQREAQYALFRAVERGQISGAAPAESRIRTVTIAGSSDDRRRPGR